MQILLYELRKNANLTQKDMAEKLKISELSYRRKEKGLNAFNQDEMFFLSNFFHKPMQEIFLPRKSPKRKLIKQT